jgi:hypothetical protein
MGDSERMGGKPTMLAASMLAARKRTAHNATVTKTVNVASP